MAGVEQAFGPTVTHLNDGHERTISSTVTSRL
jgi:hypothetical protein